MSPDVAGNQRVVIGKISGLYGVRGGLKVYSYTDPRERIFSYAPWLLRINSEWLTWEVVANELSGQKLVVYLKDITDRDQACRLVGADIAITRDQLPALRPGEYYWSDLLGMEVVDLRGRTLGQVVKMQETGANDVMVVAGDSRYLIPWVERVIVKDVDIGTGRITVDWDPEYQ